MSGIPRDAVVFPLGGHVSAAVLDHLRHRRIPLAGTGYPAIDGVLQLTMERAALRTLATHLYDLGHRDVALVEMPQGASRGEGDTTAALAAQSEERSRGARRHVPTPSRSSKAPRRLRRPAPDALYRSMPSPRGSGQRHVRVYPHPYKHSQGAAGVRCLWWT